MLPKIWQSETGFMSYKNWHTKKNNTEDKAFQYWIWKIIYPSLSIQDKYQLYNIFWEVWISGKPDRQTKIIL